MSDYAKSERRRAKDHERYLRQRENRLSRKKAYDQLPAVKAVAVSRMTMLRAKYPEKHRARELTRLAIKRGDLVRLPCVKCGDGKSEAHHPDYSKPLEVVWLCRAHHVEADTLMKSTQTEENRMMPKMIAEVAYSVYAKMTDNKNVRGEELPMWQDLGERIQNAWIAAAEAVRNPKLTDLADRPLVDAFDRLRLAIGDPELTVNQGETIEIALIDYTIEKLADGNGVVAA